MATTDGYTESICAGFVDDFANCAATPTSTKDMLRFGRYAVRGSIGEMRIDEVRFAVTDLSFPPEPDSDDLVHSVELRYRGRNVLGYNVMEHGHPGFFLDSSTDSCMDPARFLDPRIALHVEERIRTLHGLGHVTAISDAF